MGCKAAPRGVGRPGADGFRGRPVAVVAACGRPGGVSPRTSNRRIRWAGPGRRPLVPLGHGPRPGGRTASRAGVCAEWGGRGFPGIPRPGPALEDSAIALRPPPVPGRPQLGVPCADGGPPPLPTGDGRAGYGLPQDPCR